MGSNKRAQLMENVTGAVKSAGTLTAAAAAIAVVALLVSLVALIVTVKRA